MQLAEKKAAGILVVLFETIDAVLHCYSFDENQTVNCWFTFQAKKAHNGWWFFVIL